MTSRTICLTPIRIHRLPAATQRSTKPVTGLASLVVPISYVYELRFSVPPTVSQEKKWPSSRKNETVYPQTAWFHRTRMRPNAWRQESQETGSMNRNQLGENQ
jgi:hypothetical protein